MATQKTISRGIGVLILLALIGYAYFEARPFLSGPQLTLTEPAEGFIATESPLTISGTARNITKITLNGNPIFVDETGVFHRSVPLSPGYQVIEVSVEDRFGRTRTMRVSGLYTPTLPMPTPLPTASSTSGIDDTLDAATTSGAL